MNESRHILTLSFLGRANDTFKDRRWREKTSQLLVRWELDFPEATETTPIRFGNLDGQSFQQRQA